MKYQKALGDPATKSGKDLKYKALNENLLKVRDKYGIDIVKYASEELV